MKKRAVDTNVLVRILSDNGTDQTRRARALLTSGPVRIGITVLLEAEWVLRSRFALDRTMVNFLLSSLFEADAFELEHAAKVRLAILAHRRGFDFADALHLHLADCDEFFTFDRRFLRRAKPDGNLPMVLEP